MAVTTSESFVNFCKIVGAEGNARTFLNESCKCHACWLRLQESKHHKITTALLLLPLKQKAFLCLLEILLQKALTPLYICMSFLFLAKSSVTCLFGNVKKVFVPQKSINSALHPILLDTCYQIALKCV